MLNSLSKDELMALLMYHTSRFRYFYNSGVLLSTDSSDAYKHEELKYHAVLSFFLCRATMDGKQFGFVKKQTIRLMIKKIENTLIKVGLLLEILQRVNVMVEEVGSFNEEDFAKGMQTCAKAIISLSPTLNPKQVELLFDTKIEVQAKKLGLIPWD